MGYVLRVEESFFQRGAFVLQWFCDGETGGAVGDDGGKPGKLPEPEDREKWETWVANKLAAETASGRRNGNGEFFWETRSGAERALRAIKLAWRNRERSLPEWAKQALAAGWKAPNGWKP